MADLQGQACTYQSERYEVVKFITGVCLWKGMACEIKLHGA